jgi:alpha-glucoside transport system permease protein
MGAPALRKGDQSMQNSERIPGGAPSQSWYELLAWPLRLLISLIVPVFTFIILWQGFIFLRASDTPKLVQAVVAIIWGVGGAAALYVIANWMVEQLPAAWRSRILPFVFVGPALAIMSWYLVIPTLRTLYFSFFNATSDQFVGIANYVYAFTSKPMLESFRNNLLWLVIGTGMSVILGLLVAVLADRSRFENLAKVMIFLPQAISLVGAGTIWRFIYFYKPQGEAQIGLLNALVTFFGGDAVNWIIERPWNNLFLIVIMIWLQTGYAMVLLSGALKGVPVELLEAARIDGASEIQAFFSIIIPYIRGTIIMVATTILIATLKIFDIVWVMTQGNYGTEVIATQFYKQMFKYFDFGRGGAVAIVLFLAVMPAMIYNLRQFREREAF